MPETWEQLQTYIQQLELENAELQRQLAEANDWYEHEQIERVYR